LSAKTSIWAKRSAGAEVAVMGLGQAEEEIRLARLLFDGEGELTPFGQMVVSEKMQQLLADHHLRVARVKRRMAGTFAASLGLAVALWLGLGGWYGPDGWYGLGGPFAVLVVAVGVATCAIIALRIGESRTEYERQSAALGQYYDHLARLASDAWARRAHLVSSAIAGPAKFFARSVGEIFLGDVFEAVSDD
jgi:hypothetical protein